MGLEGVEILMACEEAFGAEITDADVDKLRTPGQLIDVICAKLTLTDEKTCQSQRAFYLLRRAVMKVLKKPRSGITPDTPLQSLAPGWDCTGWWFQLRDAIGAKTWPKLDRPPVVFWANHLLALAAWVGVTARLMIRGEGFWGALTLGFLVWVLAEIVLLVATIPFKRSVPAQLHRLRDLVPYVATASSISWSRELVAGMVKQIVIEQLGIGEELYREDADLAKDLGME